MKNFVKYAQFFNVFYKDKNYKKEVDYINCLINHYDSKRKKTLLDIGCGTGNHDFWFAKKEYQVVGIDKSREMITIARNRNLRKSRVEFYLADACQFDLYRKFDVAVALFHVMSYLTTNELFIKSLRSIYRHLRKGGLFIFDFWYGPAVLTQRPERRIKNIIFDDININRIAKPQINFNSNTVKVDYKITTADKNKGSTETIKESHNMRYFFLPELDFMLNQAGFKIAKSLKWLSNKESPSPKSWSGLIVAKKD